MLWTIFVILLVLWLLGIVTSYTLGGFIHILLVLAVVALIFQLISGRRTVSRVASMSAPRTTNLKGVGKTGALHQIFLKVLTKEVSQMDKDRVKGKLDDAAGRAKRQVGEWTGDTGAQVEGAAQQVKGKAENAWGKVKDAARDAADEANVSMKRRRSRTSQARTTKQKCA